MEYISAKQASARWSISPTRITVLAKQGRIAGAVLVGKSWMIPANAEKPQDARCSRAARSKIFESEQFIFPIFLYQNVFGDEAKSRLPKEAHRLYDAQYLFQSGKSQEAFDILKDYLPTCRNRYLRIGALYTMCIASFFLQDFENFNHCFHQLNHIFSEDFAYKKELEFVLLDLESYHTGNISFTQDFLIDPAYSYHPECRAYLLVEIVYAELFRCLKSERHPDLSLLELDLQQLYEQHYYFAAQSCYAYLACIHMLQKNNELGMHHLRRALELAEKTGFFGGIVFVYTYIPEIIDEILAEFPSDFAEALRNANSNFTASFHAFLSLESRSKLFSVLSRRDYSIAACIVQGMRNREIAEKLGLSESSVSKSLCEIYRKTGLHNKRELRELYQSTLLDYSDKN